MFLFRKISRVKWDSEKFPTGRIQADAITADLRTSENALSFWTSPTDDDKALNEVALAMVANPEKPGPIDLVWFPQESLREEFTWKDTLGETLYKKMADRHIDACQLDYEALGKIARHIVTAIKKQQLKRFKPGEIKSLLAVESFNDE